MKKIAVVTDSNSGLSPEQAKKLGIYVLPMPFTIDGVEYFEDITLGKTQFFEMLEEDAEISTSQPALGDVTDLWDALLKEYDEVVHIPMSSSLSGSCESAMMLAQDYDGKVCVVNNQRISVTQYFSAVQALELAKKGYDAAQIKEILEREKMESSIYIMVDTLKYLKKGGRVTPAGAAIGTLLNIKPVLQIQGGKLDAYAKCRGAKLAKKQMQDAMDKDLQERFADCFAAKKIKLFVVHTRNFEQAEEFQKELMEKYPGIAVETAELSLSVSCHIGPGALAIACDTYLPELR